MAQQDQFAFVSLGALPATTSIRFLVGGHEHADVAHCATPGRRVHPGKLVHRRVQNPTQTSQCTGRASPGRTLRTVLTNADIGPERPQRQQFALLRLVRFSVVGWQAWAGAGVCTSSARSWEFGANTRADLEFARLRSKSESAPCASERRHLPGTGANRSRIPSAKGGCGLANLTPGSEPDACKVWICASSVLRLSWLARGAGSFATVRSRMHLGVNARTAMCQIRPA